MPAAAGDPVRQGLQVERAGCQVIYSAVLRESSALPPVFSSTAGEVFVGAEVGASTASEVGCLWRVVDSSIVMRKDVSLDSDPALPTPRTASTD